MRLDCVKRAVELRKALVRDGKVLVAEFADTLQGRDTSRVVDLMPNVNTGELVFRAKVNVKEIDPLAAVEYKTSYLDTDTAEESDIEKLIRGAEFDYPLWFKHSPWFGMRKVLDYNLPFILQVAGCNFHDGSAKGGCWYCFVDDVSNDGRRGKGKTYLSAKDAVDSFVAARARTREIYRKEGKDADFRVARVSGGEPTLALDWILKLWQEIERRGLNFVGQMDTNLSTGSVVEAFEREGIYEPRILEKLARYPVKVLTAIKGVDEDNLGTNVQSDATLAEQRNSLIKLIRAGFDVYPTAYNPNPAALKQYLADMDKIVGNFSLRLHIGPLKLYGPNRKRVALEAERIGVPADELIGRKQEEWTRNYREACSVMNDYLQERHGVGYKQLTRSDVKLELVS